MEPKYDDLHIIGTPQVFVDGDSNTMLTATIDWAPTVRQAPYLDDSI